jgi:Uma2 family endonuclease
MSSSRWTAASLDDLYDFDGKAELIGRRIVPLMAIGRKPNRIVRSLDDHAEASGQGEAYTENMGFAVPELSSGRESFSPDASYYLGPFPPNDMRFIEGPPTLAVEVRSENDYGDAAEEAIEAKRADYFEAGTAIVRDVAPVNQLIRKYRREAPDQPLIFRRGEQAEAEPAVAGWRMAVDRIFT